MASGAPGNVGSKADGFSLVPPNISDSETYTDFKPPNSLSPEQKVPGDIVPTPGGLADLLGCVPRLSQTPPPQPVALAFRGRVGVGRGVYKLEPAHPRFLVAFGLTGTRAQTASWSRGHCVLNEDLGFSHGAPRPCHQYAAEGQAHPRSAQGPCRQRAQLGPPGRRLQERAGGGADATAGPEGKDRRARGDTLPSFTFVAQSNHLSL